MPLPPAPDEALPVAPAPVAAGPAVDQASINPWPWLAAVLALLLGGGFLWWRRGQRDSLRYAGDAPASAPVSLQDPSPRPDALPLVASPPPAPAPAPAPTPAPLGIVASGLKPRIELALIPLLAEVDAQQGAALTVEVIVSNRGSAPARDVIVDALLVNAAADVNTVVGRFFQQPTATGQQVAMIRPMSSVSLTMKLEVAAAALSPILVEGRQLLVPVVALNAQYRGSGGAMKDSVSFLVGRGEAEAAKLAPFRLDVGARRWSGLAARLHSNGLEPTG